MENEKKSNLYKKFKNVFPEFSVWNSFLTRIVLLIGSREKVSINKERFDKNMENPELGKVAEEMKVRSFLDFADFFLSDGNRLSAYLKGAQEITDDKPSLEFSQVSLLPPMKWETDESFLNILRHRINQMPPLDGVGQEEIEDWENTFSQDLKNFIEANVAEGSSINDFINRINPKDINKLQLEGLAKAGVFDDFLVNSCLLYTSPSPRDS